MEERGKGGNAAACAGGAVGVGVGVAQATSQKATTARETRFEQALDIIIQ
jgi:hypothetical protein